jgi:hypothetical protein
MCAPEAAAMTAVPATPATRRIRRLRAACTMAGVSVRTVLRPRTPARRQRLRVCRAADVLTALGVRVRVVGPATPWPRADRVVASDHTGRLGDLALATAVRGIPVLGVDVAEVPPGSVVCPVAIRYRTDDGELLPPDQVPSTLTGIAGTRGLVVEVHRLPAEG